MVVTAAGIDSNPRWNSGGTRGQIASEFRPPLRRDFRLVPVLARSPMCHFVDLIPEARMHQEWHAQN